MSTQLEQDFETKENGDRSQGQTLPRPAGAPPLREVLAQAKGAEETPSRRRGPRPIVLGAIAVAVLTLGGLAFRTWWYGRSHVSSDDAQVEGHIVPVLPKVTGYVAQVRVEENQAVREGDLLVVLDDRDLRAQLAQAQADLAVAQAAVGGSRRPGQAQAQLAAARAGVLQAEAGDWKAQKDLDRYRALEGQGVIGRQQLESFEAAARTAQAQLQASRDQTIGAAAGVRSAEAKVASALAARDQAALQLSYTRITAPSSGVVSKKTVEVGQLVQAGQPLFSIVPLSDVWVVANLKETQLARVSTGARVDVEVDTYPGRRFSGRVESLSPATGARFSLLPPDNATGNFTKVVQRVPVRIRLDGPADPAHPLRPGMSAKVVIVT